MDEHTRMDDDADFKEKIWLPEHPSTAEAARLIIVGRGLNISLDEVELRPGPSLLRDLVEGVADAAMNYAKSIGATPEQQLKLSWPGLEVIKIIRIALVETSAGYDNADFWEHAREPRQLIFNDKCPFIRRDLVEGGATAYLQLPYRAPALERLLVDVLVATELYGYGKEMIVRQPVWLDDVSPPRSPIHEPSVVSSFIKMKFWGAVVCFGIAAAAIVRSKLPRSHGRGMDRDDLRRPIHLWTGVQHIQAAATSPGSEEAAGRSMGAAQGNGRRVLRCRLSRRHQCQAGPGVGNEGRRHRCRLAWDVVRNPR